MVLIIIFLVIIIKITASAGQGNKDRISEHIRRFKNEKDPSLLLL